jgi:uncharacterized damage-inducible protein DinB
MTTHDLERFMKTWEFESRVTAKLLRSLPPSQYDFRPDAGGRSLGELAWHLAEIDAYMTFGIEQGKFDPGSRPPGIERPKTIEALAPGYERVHAEAVARARKFKPEDLDREITFFDGRPMKASDILWLPLMHHLIHHRGQLVLMARLAGGVPPGIYGPTREETEAMRARR